MRKKPVVTSRLTFLSDMSIIHHGSLTPCCYPFAKISNTQCQRFRQHTSSLMLVGFSQLKVFLSIPTTRFRDTQVLAQLLRVLWNGFRLYSPLLPRTTRCVWCSRICYGSNWRESPVVEISKKSWSMHELSSRQYVWIGLYKDLPLPLLSSRSHLPLNTFGSGIHGRLCPHLWGSCSDATLWTHWYQVRLDRFQFNASKCCLFPTASPAKEIVFSWLQHLIVSRSPETPCENDRECATVSGYICLLRLLTVKDMPASWDSLFSQQTPS